jgi:hypothetical protein
MPNLLFIQSHIEGTKSDIIKDSRTEELILRVLEDQTELICRITPDARATLATVLAFYESARTGMTVEPAR